MPDLQLEAAQKHFERVTKGHRMTVLHDQGVYRHLRFMQEDTWIYGYDLVTWPGHLAINGDLDSGFTFRRIDDMIHFFDEPTVNPVYWEEKLTYRQSKTRVYDTEADYDPDDGPPWTWDPGFLLSCFAVRAGCKTYLAHLEGAET